MRTQENAAWNHEDTAGSPIHFVLIIFAMVSLSYTSALWRSRFGLHYAVVLGMSFLLVSLVGFSGNMLRHPLSTRVLSFRISADRFSVCSMGAAVAYYGGWANALLAALHLV